MGNVVGGLADGFPETGCAAWTAASQGSSAHQQQATAQRYSSEGGIGNDVFQAPQAILMEPPQSSASSHVVLHVSPVSTDRSQTVAHLEGSSSHAAERIASSTSVCGQAVLVAPAATAAATAAGATEEPTAAQTPSLRAPTAAASNGQCGCDHRWNIDTQNPLHLVKHLDARLTKVAMYLRYVVDRQKQPVTVTSGTAAIHLWTQQEQQHMEQLLQLMEAARAKASTCLKFLNAYDELDSNPHKRPVGGRRATISSIPAAPKASELRRHSSTGVSVTFSPSVTYYSSSSSSTRWVSPVGMGNTTGTTSSTTASSNNSSTTLGNLLGRSRSISSGGAAGIDSSSLSSNSLSSSRRNSSNGALAPLNTSSSSIVSTLSQLMGGGVAQDSTSDARRSSSGGSYWGSAAASRSTSSGGADPGNSSSTPGLPASSTVNRSNPKAEEAGSKSEVVSLLSIAAVGSFYGSNKPLSQLPIPENQRLNSSSQGLRTCKSAADAGPCPTGDRAQYYSAACEAVKKHHSYAARQANAASSTASSSSTTAQASWWEEYVAAAEQQGYATAAGWMMYKGASSWFGASDAATASAPVATAAEGRV